MAVRIFQFQDTLYSLILPGISSAFNIFLLRQAFKTIPDDLIDAARIDGASELRIWSGILLPNIRPALASAAIFTMIGSWNALLWPVLMLNTRERYTLPVGLLALRGQFSFDFRLIAAGAIIAIIPILVVFIALQKQFVKGMSGAVKG
jgi:putative chitobiose transport system permease protein